MAYRAAQRPAPCWERAPAQISCPARRYSVDVGMCDAGSRCADLVSEPPGPADAVLNVVAVTVCALVLAQGLFFVSQRALVSFRAKSPGLTLLSHLGGIVYVLGSLPLSYSIPNTRGSVYSLCSLYFLYAPSLGFGLLNITLLYHYYRLYRILLTHRTPPTDASTWIACCLSPWFLLIVAGVLGNAVNYNVKVEECFFSTSLWAILISLAFLAQGLSCIIMGVRLRAARVGFAVFVEWKQVMLIGGLSTAFWIAALVFLFFDFHLTSLGRVVINSMRLTMLLLHASRITLPCLQRLRQMLPRRLLAFNADNLQVNQDDLSLTGTASLPSVLAAISGDDDGARDVAEHHEPFRTVAFGSLDNVKQLLVQHQDLLQLRDNLRQSVLHHAARRGRSGAITMWSQQDPEAVAAASVDHNGYGETALHIAVGAFDDGHLPPELLSEPIALSAADHLGETPLHRAAITGKCGSMRQILQAAQILDDGAESLVARLLKQPTQDSGSRRAATAGMTVSHIMAWRGDEDMLLLLLEFRARIWSVQTTRRKQLPYHVAALHGRVRIARQLLHELQQRIAAGTADPGVLLAVDSSGRTLLHAAAAGMASTNDECLLLDLIQQLRENFPKSNAWLNVQSRRSSETPLAALRCSIHDHERLRSAEAIMSQGLDECPKIAVTWSLRLDFVLRAASLALVMAQLLVFPFASSSLIPWPSGYASMIEVADGFALLDAAALFPVPVSFLDVWFAVCVIVAVFLLLLLFAHVPIVLLRRRFILPTLAVLGYLLSVPLFVLVSRVLLAVLDCDLGVDQDAVGFEHCLGPGHVGRIILSLVLLLGLLVSSMRLVRVDGLASSLDFGHPLDWSGDHLQIRASQLHLLQPTPSNQLLNAVLLLVRFAMLAITTISASARVNSAVFLACTTLVAASAVAAPALHNPSALLTLRFVAFAIAWTNLAAVLVAFSIAIPFLVYLLVLSFLVIVFLVVYRLRVRRHCSQPDPIHSSPVAIAS